MEAVVEFRRALIERCFYGMVRVNKSADEFPCGQNSSTRPAVISTRRPVSKLRPSRPPAAGLTSAHTCRVIAAIYMSTLKEGFCFIRASALVLRWIVENECV